METHRRREEEKRSPKERANRKKRMRIPDEMKIHAAAQCIGNERNGVKKKEREVYTN